MSEHRRHKGAKTESLSHEVMHVMSGEMGKVLYLCEVQSKNASEEQSSFNIEPI